MEEQRRSYALQMLGSFVVAVLIVLIAVAVVTNRIGPGVETREREEESEELREEREELREEREEAREERQEN